MQLIHRANIFIIVILAFYTLGLSNTYANAIECEDTEQNINFWREIRKTAETVDANEYAFSLSYCLASPNSELRDRIGYEVLTFWLRTDKLDDKTILSLKDKLLIGLTAGAGEVEGELAFERAFSALILSELVRDDILNRRWSATELNIIINASVKMFNSERDYRGLDAKFGWIHTIAHGSDLLWRLSLHPETNAQQQQLLLSSLTNQIAKPNSPAYVFNEADRLARVVVAIVSSDKLDSSTIVEWITNLGDSAPMKSWNTAFASPEGMARLHNTKQFLRALRWSLQSTEQTKEQSVLVKAIDETLSKLP